MMAEVHASLQDRSGAVGSLPSGTLEVLENGLLGHILVRSNDRKDSIQRPDPEMRMRRNSNTMGSWLLSLQNNVTADLVNSLVSPALAEVLDQLFSAQIAWQFHATASTSSRTRCKRMEAGGTESK